MKGAVLAQGNGNLTRQLRVFQEKLAGATAGDKAYGLDSAILDLIPKVNTDFVKSKSSPLVHSELVTIYQKDDKGAPTTIETGEMILVCFNSVMEEEMEAEYNMD